MKVLLLALAAVALLLFGCASGPAGPAIGSGTDSNGCVLSSGYSWCEALQKCIKASEQNCTAQKAPLPGSDRDSHGCIPSAGYTWCEAKAKCIRQWEENCTAQVAPPAPEQAAPLESIARVFCGRANVSAVYVCSDYVRVVSSLEGAGSRFYKNGVGTPVRCPVVAPDSESDECRLLLSGNNCTEKKVC